MAQSKSFQLSVVTPEQVVVECEARFVSLPAHDGEMGVLAQRAPMLTRLDVGPLRIEAADGDKRMLFIDGGFAEMVANRLTILTESAVEPDELTREAADELLAESRHMRVRDDGSFAVRQRTARKARAQLRVLKS